MTDISTYLFIEVESGDYPLNFYQIAQRLKNVSFSPNPDVTELTDIGYAVVTLTDRPTGDVVTEGAPELVEGVWQQTWVVRPYTDTENATRLATLKAGYLTRADAVREADIGYGMRFEFTDGGDGGVQLRPADRTNHFGLRMEADAYIAAGAGDELIEFRTLENTTRVCHATEIVTLTNAALQHVKTVYAASWAYKDSVTAATVYADVPAVPTTFLV